MEKQNNQNLSREQIISRISEGASPAELSLLLQQLEISDQKDTLQILDELNAEFASNGNLIEEVLVPVLTSIVDGVLEWKTATRKLRRKGLTASRIVQECRTFTYENPGKPLLLADAYGEYKNMRDRNISDKKYDRQAIEDKTKMNQYKEDKFAHNGGKINAQDEYSLDKNIYKNAANPDARRNIQKYKHSHRAETDHIEPLKKIHERLKGNYALDDNDIKEIANQDNNFALTSAKINRGAGAPGEGGKFEMTAEEFVREQERRERKGLPNLGLTKEQKRNILKKGKEAHEAINNSTNKRVAQNLTSKEKAPKIIEKTAKNAASQAGDVVIGNVIIFMIKPLYYELSDIIKNGMNEGVDVSSTKEALKIRMGRIKDYVCENIIPLVQNNIKAFIISFVSSIIEGIISLFVGIFKQVLKLAKEGVKICMQSFQIVFGKNNEQMSPAEKGDAIVKLIGGSVIAICGIGLEAWLNSMGVIDPLSTILATALSGIASVLFMVLLDRLDLFSVKAQKRYDRIEEIFNLRIAEINKASDMLNATATLALAKSQMRFDDIRNAMQYSLQNRDMDSLFVECTKMAEYYKIDLPFNTLEEGVEYIDKKEKIILPSKK